MMSIGEPGGIGVPKSGSENCDRSRRVRRCCRIRSQTAEIRWKRYGQLLKSAASFSADAATGTVSHRNGRLMTPRLFGGFVEVACLCLAQRSTNRRDQQQQRQDADRHSFGPRNHRCPKAIKSGYASEATASTQGEILLRLTYIAESGEGRRAVLFEY